MNRQSAALVVAALTLSGCISSGGSPFDLIPLSEKVLMTAGTPPQQASTAPISVEELLQRARISEKEAAGADALKQVSSTIDLSGSNGALTGSALIAVGRFVDEAQIAEARSVVVETSPTVEPLSAAAREAVGIASLLRRAGFKVEMRRAESLQANQVGLRALRPGEDTLAAVTGTPS